MDASVKLAVSQGGAGAEKPAKAVDLVAGALAVVIWPAE